MNRTFARRCLSLSIALSALAGCEGRPKADQVIPVDQVPPNLMEIAKKELPGYTFDTVYKMKVDGEDAYEIRGKNKDGKVREVEVSASGKVLEIE